MKLTNQQIIEYAQQLAVFENCEIKLPVKINFFLQKNIRTLYAAAQEIEAARLDIGKNHGELTEDGMSYHIKPENYSIVNKELAELFTIEQELSIVPLSLESFSDIELTYQQMSAIMFMIEE